jgi:hypothetical protein
MPQLTRLLYYSRLTDKLTPTTVFKRIKPIMVSALKRNPPLGITGALIFNETFFIQAMEGDQGRVSELFLRISKDRRHTAVTIADCRAVQSRAFDDWAMTFMNPDALSAEAVKRFKLEGEFHPGKMDSQMLLRFMEEVFRTGQVIRTDKPVAEAAA